MSVLLLPVQICPKPEVALKIKQGDSGNATRSQRTLLGPENPASHSAGKNGTKLLVQKSIQPTRFPIF